MRITHGNEPDSVLPSDNAGYCFIYDIFQICHQQPAGRSKKIGDPVSAPLSSGGSKWQGNFSEGSDHPVAPNRVKFFVYLWYRP